MMSETAFEKLCLACQAGRVGEVRTILSSLSPVEARPSELSRMLNKEWRNCGQTPLHLSAGNKECIELLVSAGADPNKSVAGKTPLFRAVFIGAVDCIDALLALGGDPNKIDDNGHSPLFTAVTNGSHECTEKLLEGGADPNIISDDGWSCLYRAIERFDSKCVDMLLARGAISSVGNLSMWCDLHIATLIGNDAGVKYLLKKGEDLRSTERGTHLAHQAI